MKIIINESQYKLINETIKKSSFQNTLNETLKMLKGAAEAEPRDFRPIFSDNIDNVKSIDIVSINKEYIRSDIKLIINVVVTLDFDIPFGKWEAIAEILDEIRYYMKPEIMIGFKLQLADNGVKILNNIERDI
jgi:glycosylphosphatidylinositol transamidase (GPIT) subunit GPI8